MMTESPRGFVTALELSRNGAPPHDREAEQALLGCALLDGAIVGPAAEIGVDECVFYPKAHRAVWKAIRALADAGSAIDILTVTGRLADLGLLEDAGGTEYISALPNGVPAVANWRAYAERLLALRRRRDLIRAASSVLHLAFNTAGQDLEEVDAQLAVLGDRLLASRNGAAPTAPDPLSLPQLYALPPTVDAWEVAPLIRRAGVNLIVGDSDSFKTWWAMALARDLARGAAFLERFAVAGPRRVLLLELEMHAVDVAERFRLLGAAPELPIQVDCAASFSFDDPVQRRWLLAQEVDVIIVDSLIRAHARDENAAGAMAALNREGFRPLLDRGRTLIFTHHTKKPAPGAPNEPAHLIRGTTDLRALADSVLFLKRLDHRSVLVRHDKSRFGPAVDAFVVGFDATEGMVRLTHEGAASVALDKLTAAKEAVLAEIGSTALRTGDLIDRLKATYRERTVRRAIRTLEEDGAISPSKVGRNTYWSLETTPAKVVADVWR